MELDSIHSRAILSALVHPREWLESETFRCSSITLRFCKEDVEAAFVQWWYGGSLTWSACVAYGCLVPALMLVEAATWVTPSTTERFAIICVAVLTAAGFAALMVCSMCLSTRRYVFLAHERGVNSEGYKKARWLEVMVASLVFMALVVSSILSFRETVHDGIINVRSVKNNPRGTTLNDLFIAVLLMSTGLERPRCIMAIPILFCTIGALVVGTFVVGSTDRPPDPNFDCWDGPPDARRAIQLGVFVVLVCICCGFRWLRERRLRRHFELYILLNVHREQSESQHRELIRIAERFVPTTTVSKESNTEEQGNAFPMHTTVPGGFAAVDINPKGVCFVVEITNKGTLLPRNSEEVVAMAKVVIRIENHIKQVTDGTCVERVAFGGDAFYCVSGLQKEDALGTRTLDMVTAAYRVLSEAAAKWRPTPASTSDMACFDLRAGLHTGLLEGCAIGRSTFHYALSGECLLVSRGIVSHASANQLIVTQEALESCGNKVKYVPLQPIDSAQNLPPIHAFYITGVDGIDAATDDGPEINGRSPNAAAGERGTILDLLVTPQFQVPRSEETDPKGPAHEEQGPAVSESNMTEIPNERSNTVNAVSGLNDTTMTSDTGGVLFGHLSTGLSAPRSISATSRLNAVSSTGGQSAARKPRHFFHNALSRSQLLEERLQRDIDGCVILHRLCRGLERFAARDKEQHFVRVRGMWNTLLRLAMLVIVAIIFFTLNWWQEILQHTPNTVVMEISTPVWPQQAQFLVAEIVLWATAASCFFLRVGFLRNGNTAVKRMAKFLTKMRCLRHWGRRRVMYHLWIAETIVIGFLVFLVTLSAYATSSTWTRRVPSLLWLLLFCVYYAQVPFLASLVMMLISTCIGTATFSIAVGYWRLCDVIHVIVMLLFYTTMAWSAEWQDRRFFRDAVLTKASANNLKKKEEVFLSVMRATIPRLLHAFHRAVKANTKGKSSLAPSSGRAVVTHDQLVVSMLSLEGLRMHTGRPFNALIAVERSVEAANRVLDALLSSRTAPPLFQLRRVSKRSTAGGRTESSETSDSDDVSPVGGKPQSAQTSKASLCIVRCIGDTVTLAGLPSPTNNASNSKDEETFQVGALVGCMVYSWMHLLRQNHCESMSNNPGSFDSRPTDNMGGCRLTAMLSTGPGASGITYDDDPNYAVFGFPVTEAVALVQASRGQMGITSAAASSLQQVFGLVNEFALGETRRKRHAFDADADSGGVDVMNGEGEGAESDNFLAFSLRPEKRWRVKGIGAADVRVVVPVLE